MNRNSLHQVISQADQLYAGRADLSNILDSVDLLQSAQDDYEAAWRLSRSFFFLGQEAPTAARVFHQRGVKAGSNAVKQDRKRVEGHFWLGVNLALSAQLEGPFRAIRHALKAQRALSRAIEIDGAYHGAGPYRVLARLQHKLPHWLGGGGSKARAGYEQALRIAPANTVTRVYFSELLLELGETSRAREELEYVLNAPGDADWAFEIERDRKRAKEMIAKPSQDAKGASE